MSCDPEFPLQFSPTFVRYCRTLCRQHGRPVRIGIDRRRLPEILSDEDYDRRKHVRFEEDGCQILVSREDINALDGWTLVGVETLFEDFSFYRRRDAITASTHPARLKLSKRLLQNVEPEFRGQQLKHWQEKDRQQGTSRVEGTVETLATHLDRGDARAALVAAISPDVLVAAYTDELDCIAMLRFPHDIADIYDLEAGTRLITCNFYQKTDYGVALDLSPGPETSERWDDFHPLIGNFLSADDERLAELELEIPPEEWQRTEELVDDWFDRRDEGDAWPARDGSPTQAGNPSADPIMITPAIVAVSVLAVISVTAVLVWLFLK